VYRELEGGNSEGEQARQEGTLLPTWDFELDNKPKKNKSTTPRVLSSCKAGLGREQMGMYIRNGGGPVV
jgi:hypothetical protein